MKREPYSGLYLVMLRNISLIGAVLLAGASSADAKCPKWHNDLPHCWVLPLTCGGPLEFPDRQKLTDAIYADTPEQACDNAWAYQPGVDPNWPTSVNIIRSNDPANYLNCCVKWDNTRWYCNGSHVTFGMEGEPECDLEPVGPYTADDPLNPRDPVVPEQGGVFTNGYFGAAKQRDWIIARNKTRNGLPQTADPISDLQYIETDINGDQVVSIPAMIKRFTFEPYSDDPIPPELENPSDDAFQVDHMIPRVDIFHCECGTNGYNNALLIPGSNNREMSNDMRHPLLQAILLEFVPGYVPPPASVVNDTDKLDEPSRIGPNSPPSDDNAVIVSGGCSSSRPSSFALFSVLALLQFRRHSRAASRARG